MSAAEKKKGFDIQELLDSIQELDMENLGSWPTPVKLIAAILVFMGVVAGLYFFNVQGKYSELDRQKGSEKELMTQYESKAFKAQNLDQYRKQLTDMEQVFSALLEQLPKDTEVPALLEDITHTGLGSGLEFKKIKLGNEAVKEFYAELPINISVIGDYHGLGSFVSGIAAFPRIVTLDNFTIKPTSKGFGGLLSMDITAKTYRYSSNTKKKAGGGKK